MIFLQFSKRWSKNTKKFQLLNFGRYPFVSLYWIKKNRIWATFNYIYNISWGRQNPDSQMTPYLTFFCGFPRRKKNKDI